MLGRVALCIVLPSLPRSNDGTRVAWVKNIGFALIKTVEITIDDKVIDKHCGEWLYVFSKLTNSCDDRLIGNVRENTEFTDGKSEYVIHIPLQFWFCRKTSCAIPIAAIQKSDIRINVELNSLQDLLLISPTHSVSTTNSMVSFTSGETLVQKTEDDILRRGVFVRYDWAEKKISFTSTTANVFDVSLNAPPVVGEQSGYSITPTGMIRSLSHLKKAHDNIILKSCKLITEYIYLSEKERKKLIKTKTQYIVEQLYCTTNTTLSNTNCKVKIVGKHPCKLMVWMGKEVQRDKSDMFNYKTHQTKQKIISQTQILLNSQKILDESDGEYHTNVQQIDYANGSFLEGVNMHSFSLRPFDHTPTGTVNLSKFENIMLTMRMNNAVSPSNKVEFTAYCLCYNVWCVSEGRSTLAYER